MDIDGIEQPLASTSKFFACPNLSQSPDVALFHGSQDLLAKFDLIDTYDEYVAPFVVPVSSTDPKGKAKETGLERQKLQKGYMHLVQDMPGKYNNLHRDNYFRMLAENPELQDVDIRIDALDDQTRAEAFTLEPGTLAEDLDTILGITQSALIARKKKKRRRKDDHPSTQQPNGTHDLASTPQGSDDHPRKRRRKDSVS